MKKNVTTTRHKNRKMSNDTYNLRRKVMAYIYEAKTLLQNNMPRIDIRITDCDDHRVLGTARMNGCVIWIPATTIQSKYLRNTVFHEILHTIVGQKHVNGCPLMSPTQQKCNDNELINSLFIKYATKQK